MKHASHLIMPKTSKKTWLMVNLFVAIFVLSQIASLSHKAQHANQSADNNCLICIHSVDHAITLHSVEVVTLDIYLVQPVSIEIYFTEQELVTHYFSRAPPVS